MRNETKVYSGPGGAVYRCESLAGVQYHARAMVKGKRVGKYYATQAGAVAWLNKKAQSK